MTNNLDIVKIFEMCANINVLGGQKLLQVHLPCQVDKHSNFKGTGPYFL